jgi:hypothetical protein
MGLTSWFRRKSCSADGKRSRQPIRMRRWPSRPVMERLEDRLAPSVTWTGNAGDHNWANPVNWSSNPSLPGANDDVTISTGSGTITIPSGTYNVHSLNDSTNALSLASGATLTFTNSASPASILGQNITVQSGASITFGTGASITIGSGIAFTVNGTVTFLGGNAVTFPNAGFSSSQLVVGAGGTLNATGTTFGGTNGNDAISVSAGGHFLPSGCTVGVAVWLPTANVADLGGASSNASFGNIDIFAGTLGSGQVSLNAIGLNTANLQYIFSGAFTVASGATLTVGNGVAVVLGSNIVLTDNGTLGFSSGDAVAFPNAGFASSQIVVGAGGALNATSTTFGGTDTNDAISVSAGGHFLPGGCAVGVAVWLPAANVADLGGASSNVSFGNIDIFAGTLGSGQVSLNAIGLNTANLQYIFSGAFTVASGATLTVGNGVAVVFGSNIILTDNGTLAFSSGDAVAFPNAGFASSQIVVGAGGALNATSTTFGGTNTNDAISVSAGGHFLPSGCAVGVAVWLPAANVADLGSANGNVSFGNIEIFAGSLGSGQVSLNAIGVNTASLQYIFAGAFTVASGATLTVGSGVSVAVGSGLVLTDNGTVTFSSDAVAFPNGGFSSSQLVVGAGGTLNATGTTIGGTNGNDAISVSAGGHFLPSGCTVGVAVWLPAANVSDLGSASSNVSFGNIDIFAGTLGSGQANLNAIGQNTANLQYIFAAAFTVAAGATLTVGSGVAVVLSSGTVLTDNGTMTFNSNDSVACPTAGTASQLVVGPGGTLSATGTTFSGTSGDLISVTAGGHFVPSGCTVGISVWLPAANVADLGGASSNASLGNIDIVSGTLASGQVTLSAIGLNTTNLQYIFSSTFTVAAGATLTVGSGVAVVLSSGTVLTDNGTMTFNSNDSVACPTAGTASQLVVGPGGTLSTTGTTFSGTSGDLISVTAGGHFVPSGCTVGISVWLPAANVADLGGASSNASFGNIDIVSGTLASGQVTLSAIGLNTTNLQYIFSSTFTVAAGATLTVGSGVAVVLSSGTVLTNNGTMTFNSNDSVACPTAGTASQLVVGPGGALSVTGTTFSGTSADQISINSSGSLTANLCTFGLPSLTLNAGAAATIQYDYFSSKFTIDSGATLAVHLNDFTNVPANGIIAAGSAGSTIDLTSNYWGDPALIPNKIDDHNKNSALPTVVYNPTLSGHPTTTVGTSATAAYNAADQFVSLTATVTSPSGTVSEGTVTFTVTNGGSTVGSSMSGSVVSGKATVNYKVPGGTPIFTYTIQLLYNGTSNFLISSDNTHTLSLGVAPTSTAATNLQIPYNVADQVANLSATVTSAGGTVNGGTETFTILDSKNNTVGTPTQASVSNGAANIAYTIPGGTTAGPYTIQAVYSGNALFAGSSENGHTLTVATVTSSTASSNVSTTFSTQAQSVNLSATVSSSAGTVNEGNETFTILHGSTPIGSPITVPVTSGSASTGYPLPAGQGGGTYTIKAAYNGTGNINASLDTTHTLTINPANTTTASGNVSVAYSAASQTVNVGATVSSSAGVVSEGTVTFRILSGSTLIAGPVAGTVSGGSATANVNLPAGTAPGSYTIDAEYATSTGDFVSSSDTSHSLTVNPAPNASVSVSLEAGSDSGAPDHPGYTNDTTPTFDVQVNQAGKIVINFDGNSAHNQTLNVTAAGTYLFTAPTLANGAYTATATFDASLAGFAQSSTNYTIDSVTPQGNAMSPTDTVNNRVGQVTLTFSELMDLGTLTPSAITLTGPGGNIPVNQPTWVSGTTYAVNFLSQTAQGSYTLTVAGSVTDYAANPMGQSFSRSFTIALPDLGMMTTSAPSSAAEGATIPLSWKVANVSASNSTGGNWNDTVYVSTKPTLDYTAYPLATLPGSALAPGSNYMQNASATIPGFLPTGNYYLLFAANADNGQAEADAGSDTNDLIADPITLTAADLQVASVTGPATGMSGKSALVSWIDKNTGTGVATGPWVDNVYTTSDAQGHDAVLLGSYEFDGTLAVGATVQRTQSVILPQTAGPHYFFVTVNATHSAPEGGAYGNNSAASATTINLTAPLLPDLVVTGITAPPNGVFSGNSVPISFTVKNRGQAATTAPVWQDWVILSQDATLAQAYQGQLNPTGPGGDQILNNQPIIVGVNNPSYLDVGDSYQQTLSVTLPLNAQGVWYVYVVPDGTGFHHPFAMPEMSRSDKLAISTGFSVTLSPPPDLTVPVVHAPTDAFSGQPMQVSWTVANNGTGPTVASTWTDAVYMSATNTLDASATLLGTYTHRGILANGNSYTASATVTLPIGVKGSFYFLVKTDIYGQVFENGATGNNVGATTAASTVHLTPPPDLVVSAITAPSTALAGHNFTFSYTVTNAGAGATPNYSWNDSLYLSPTATFDVGTAIPLGGQYHQGSLDAAGGANSSYTNTVTVGLPNGMAGSYYVVAVTDSGNVVFEQYENNNVTVSATAIQVSQAPADLIVTSAVAPSAAVPGSAIWVNWSVTNQSTGDTAVSSWQDRVYIDTGTTLTGSAVLLDTFTHYGLLAGGASYNQAQLVTVPISLLGNYHLFVVTNTDGAVYESNTSNDTSAAVPITITQQVTGGGGTQTGDLSDLVVTAVNGNVNNNGSVSVQWTVKNIGTGPTNATYWDDDVWVSTNQALGTGGTDIYLGTVQHTNPLAAGDSYNSQGTFLIPPALPSGNYYFLVATNRPVVPPITGGGDGAGRVYEPGGNDTSSTSSPAPLQPAPLADLTVTSVTGPTSALGGSQLPVTWTVVNNGADTGSVTITDSVYLSYDQVFDPSTDLYVGSVSKAGGLAAGGSYTQSASLALRAGVAGTFYVIVVTNSDHAVPESSTTNDSGSAPATTLVQLPAPADLVAGTVTIPPDAVAGQNITITYQVTNNGSVTASGSWTDSLYLAPISTWALGDPLLGSVAETQNLAPGAHYTGTLTAPLPGVAPGSYYVILRSNILATFPEPTLANNVSASLTQTAIDAPALTLGTPKSGTLGQAQSAYYKVVVGAGQTLQVTLTGQNAAASNELYVSYGTMPTRSQYGFRYHDPFDANQQITVPSTQAGAYYILVYGSHVPSPPETYTIEASLIPFSIQTVAPSTAGTGPVTLTISGAQFNFGTTFELKNSAGAVIDASRTLWQDSATAYATFDLTTAATRSYDVWAIQPDTTRTELAAGLSVVPAVQNAVQVGLVVPSAVLAGRPGTLTVTYENPGNTDLPAPLMLLSSDNAPLQIQGVNDDAEKTSIMLYGYNSAGPFGTLPPGFHGSVTVTFTPTVSGAGTVTNFTLATVADPTQPFDWNGFAANGVPANTSPQQWAAMVAQAAPLIGSTWGQVVSFVGQNSLQLLENTAQADPSAVNRLYDFDCLLQYVVGIYGAPSPGGSTPSQPELAKQGEITLYDAQVDDHGNAVPLNPTYPTFVLVTGWGGYRADFGNLAQAIIGDTSRFPSNHVNVVIATWAGATPGLPWFAAMHVNQAGADLGTLLGTLQTQGAVNLGTTTIIGEGFGNDVGNVAAHNAGILQNAIALNPASPFAGYISSTLTGYFQNSTEYTSTAFYDSNRALAASNQTLPTGDLNNPVLQRTFGVGWLAGQMTNGNDYVIDPTYSAGPDNLPDSTCPMLPMPTGQVQTTADVVQISSHDPDSIIGPKGSGSNNLVPITRPMPYTVDFANQPTVTTPAPAPAQQVTIQDQLDPGIDSRTFRLGSFSFDNMTFSVPANSAYYQSMLNLQQQMGFDVSVTATIDESTGIATWILTTIDPATGNIPLNPTIGLLPPNDSSGSGAGSISYTVNPLATAPTGTVIYAQATIIFDTEPPLHTNTVFNTVDSGAGLTSAVNPLPAFTSASPFLVSWNGTDASNGSGIAGYTIYVTDSGGPYTAWLTNTLQTAAPFTGKDGHTYSFYSVATDYAGNVQPTPGGAEATTVVDMSPPTTTAIAFPAAGGSYNTAGWTGTISGATSDNASGVAQEQVSILDRATGKYWNGASFASSTEVFVTATLANPNATATTWSLSFASSNFPADGAYMVHARATDQAGNAEATGVSATFNYDSTPPATTDSLSGTLGTAGWYTSAVKVTLSATDATSGVAATYYRLDNGSQQSYTGSAFTVPSAGSHTVEFWSVDAAGNTEIAHTDSFKIDSTAPSTTDSLAGTLGSNGWYTSASVSVTLSATDATSGVAATYYTIDGGTQLTYSGAFPVSGDTTHHITFWSVDNAGNAETAHPVTIAIDSTTPATTDSLTGTLGSAGWYTSATVNVTLSATDTTSGIANTFYTIDGGAQRAYSGAFAVGGDGSHTIAFWSVDAAGNAETSHSHSFKIDSTRPSTTDIISGTPSNNGWYISTSVSVTLTTTDATSGVAATHYTIDGGAQQTYTGSAFTVGGDGSHTIAFWSVDGAGNTESSHTDSFKIDGTPPSTRDSLSGTPGSNGWYTSAAVTVTLSATDATSGVATTYYAVDSGAQQSYGSAFAISGDGTHHMTFWSVDNAGNIESSHSDSFNIDSTAPTTTDSRSGTLGANSWYTSATVTVTLTATDATSGVATTFYTIDGGSQHTYTGAVAVGGDGGHSVVFWSVDAAGNTEGAHSDSLMIDSTPPSTKDSLAGAPGSNSWYTSAAVNVTLSPTDATSGVATTYYTLDGGAQQSYTGALAVGGDGSHQITFWSVDAAGNAETAHSDSFKIDSAAPITTDSRSGTAGDNGWYQSAIISVMLNPTDATSGVVATYYTIDGGARQTYGGSAFNVSGDGTHPVTFWSVDAAGNTEATRTDIIKIDTAAPTTTTNLAGGWYTSPTVNVALTARDATSGVATTYYTIDGGGPRTYGDPFAVTGEGMHHLVCWSVDNAGITETATPSNFSIDSVKPATRASVAGTQQPSGWYTSASVSITLTADDATSGVAFTYYTIDGGSRQSYGGVPFPVTGDGVRHVNFWSVDDAGNIETQQSLNISIDHVSPTTTDTLDGTLAPDGWYTSATVNVTLSASDATSGVAATYYTIDGGSQQTYAGTFPVGGDGNHTVTFWSVDVAGTPPETSHTVSFKIDSIAPSTKDSLDGTPGLNGWYTSSAVTVTLSASDAGSSVAATYYTIDGGALQIYSGAFPVGGDGRHTIAFWSVDKAGNTEAVNTQTIPIDTTMPTTTDQGNASGWYTGAPVIITLRATDAASGVATTYYTLDGSGPQSYGSGGIAITGDLAHALTFWSVDNAGIEELPHRSDTIKVDTVKPVTTATISGTLKPSGWYTSATVGITLSPSDNASGVAFTYYTIDGGSRQTYSAPLPVSGEGMHTVAFYSVDVAGNIEDTHSVSFKIDSVAPHTDISLGGTKGNPDFYTSAVTVTLTPSDATSGVAATEYSLNGGARQPYTGPITLSSDGMYTLVYDSADAAGNRESEPPVTIDIDTTPPTLQLPANQTFTATQYGGGVVNYQGATATDNLGTPTLVYSRPAGTVFPIGITTVHVTATDAAGNQSTGTFNVTVTPAPADRLILGSPLSVSTGAAFTLTAETVDPFGNVDPTAVGSVALSLLASPTGGKLTGPVIAPVSGGTATFSNLALKGVGGYTLLAANSGDLLGASTSIAVVPARQLKVQLAPAVPGQTDAGQSFNVTITAQLSGSTDASYLGTVQLTSTDPQVPIQTVTFLSTDNGVKTISLVLKTPGAQTVTAIDTSLPTTRATSNSITVTGTLPLVLDHFTVAGLPGTDVTGTTQTVTITAVNAAGKMVTSYNGIVHVTSSDPAFTPTDVSVNKGVAKLPVALTTLGTQTLTVRDGSSHTTVTPGTAVVSPTTHLTISESATKVSAGGPGDPVTITVTGMTAANKTDTLLADVLQLTTSDPHAQVVASPITGGVQKFTVLFTTAGTQTIAVADLTRPTIHGSTPSVTVSAGAAAQLVIAAAPLFALAGSVSFTVTAHDHYGNPVLSGFTDTVQVVGQTYTFKTSDRGAHAFSTTLAAGSQTVTATDGNLQPGASTVTVVSSSPTLVTDPMDSSLTALVVIAPAGGTVLITAVNTAGTSVTVTITASGKTTTSVPFAPTGHLFVYGQGTGTTIKEVAGSGGATVAIPAILFGGSGKSTLSAAGSSAANVLVGGPAANTLTGGSGHDILIGGGAGASLHAGNGEDIMISGHTIYDTNVAALLSLLNEWGRADLPFEDRIHNLFGAGAYRLNGQSVLRGSIAAQLFGSAVGTDWFWFAERPSAADRISVFSSGEAATFE